MRTGTADGIGRMLAAGLIGLLVIAWLPSPAAATPWWNPDKFAADGFVAQWARTDAEAVRANRTLYWGPAPWFDYHEFYRQAPNGLRLVQYFDKARMEINDPSSGAVTNGLLVVELVSGRQKLGDMPGDSAALNPAPVPVAGDLVSTNDAPTYATFASLATIDSPTSNRAPDRRGQPVGATLDQRGRVIERPDLATQYADQTRIVEYIDATGHNIPKVLWDFLNQQGPILAEGQVRTGPVVDWLGAMGYPITDPYWVRAKVANIDRDILVQLFERRVVTYTPANPPAYQVEMGNVGQHYFAWRYPHLGPAWSVTSALSLPIYYASNRSSPHWQVVTSPSPYGGFPPSPPPDPRAETVPYSVQRSYVPNYQGLWLLVDSRRGDGTYRQLYTFSVPNPDPLIRLTYTDGAAPPPGSSLPTATRPANDYNPAVSPDGTKLAFVSDRAGQPHLFLMGFRPDPLGVAGDQIQLTRESCTHQAPSWSPDGRSLVWMANCTGNFDIYAAEIRYDEDSRAFDGRTYTTRLAANLINVRRLTTTPGDDVQPRLSPDGTTIAFEGQSGGRSAIFLMNADGGNIRRLTNSADNESAPSWSPDGRQLVYAAQRDGRWRLRTVDRDGRGEQVRPHEGPGDDRWPVWAH